MPPSARLARIARSVNISRWFRYPSGPTPGHFLTFITDADLDLLTNLGVTGVRLTIGGEQLIRGDAEDAPVEQTLACLKTAIERMVDRGLAVMVAMYGVSDRVESPFRSTAFINFWYRLAQELRSTNPDAVLFEPVNEPIFNLLPRRWRGLEEKLVAAIRSAAPHHTIVTSGPSWSSLDALLSHRPLADPNVLYTFHFYEPYAFTHQGAPWNTGWVSELQGVPYPLTPENVLASMPTMAPHFQAVLQDARHRYDAAYVDRRIASAAEWGARYGVPVWIGEFGCYPPFAPRADVLCWFHDVRTSFERHGIGCAVWSYDENLGLDRKLVEGRPVIDWDVAGALGLSIPL